MPDVTPCVICMVLRLSVFLTSDVHIAAPINMNMADKIAKEAEAKKR